MIAFEFDLNLAELGIRGAFAARVVTTRVGLCGGHVGVSITVLACPRGQSAL